MATKERRRLIRFRRRRPRLPKGPPIREQVWNLPNILTYGRIILIPFVIYFLDRCDPGAKPDAYDHVGRLASFYATLLFSLAAITDLLDGWIARNWNLGTMVGRFLDPLADKLLVMACLVMMVYLGRVPAWFVVLMLSRDLSITGLRSIAAGEGLEVHVAQSGKYKTAFQLTGLIGVLMHYEYPVRILGIGSFDFDFGASGLLLLGLSMVLSLFSAGVYFARFAAAAAAAQGDGSAGSATPGGDLSGGIGLVEGGLGVVVADIDGVEVEGVVELVDDPGGEDEGADASGSTQGSHQ